MYSCQYVYPSGVVSLSVKELKDASATKRYFEKLGNALGRRPGKLALGGGGFTAMDGSVVVRKDFKVLDVDVSKLSGPLGVPPMDARRRRGQCRGNGPRLLDRRLISPHPG